MSTKWPGTKRPYTHVETQNNDLICIIEKFSSIKITSSTVTTTKKNFHWPTVLQYVTYTAVYMLNKNGNNFFINWYRSMFGFFLKYCFNWLCFPKPLLRVALINYCLGISADMHDTRHICIAFQNSKIAGKKSQYKFGNISNT